MRIRVGHITARCEKCSCEDFQPLHAESVPAHELTCFSCGARITRLALLTQIADETVKRAEVFIEISKHARSQPNKR